MQIQDEKITVIITDDHSIFRKGVRLALAKYTDIDIIAEAEHGLDLLEKLENHKPDFILLGLKMPVMDGLDTILRLKEKYPHIKVIMLTMYEDPRFIRRLLTLGASAYLLKNTQPEEIYNCIIYLRHNWLYITDLVIDAFNNLHKPN